MSSLFTVPNNKNKIKNKKGGNQQDDLSLARMNLATHFDRSKTVGF